MMGSSHKAQNISRELQEILREIQSSCEDLGLHSLKNPLKSLQSFAGENQYLDVAVLGHFKVGKSSFLNSLINRPLLPTGSLPVTSVITRLRYGINEKAVITHTNGTRQQIELSNLNAFICETENPRNLKMVEIVEIETPAMADLKDIRLVDTPGIGSVWKHNTETTTAWFPETGGALLLISAERPISETELDLLQEIYRYSPEISIIITKTDLFSEDKLLEIESFTAQVTESTFGHCFPIFRYSTVSNTGDFKRVIMEKALLPLSGNHDEVFVKILKHKVSSLAESCFSYLEIAYNASLRAESEKQKLRETILDEHLNSSFVRQDLLLITQSYKEKTRENLRAYLAPYRLPIEEQLNQAYDTACAGWKGNLYEVTRQYEAWVKEALNAELQQVLLDEEKSYELTGAVRKHLTFYLKSFRERLTSNLERALGVTMKCEDWEIDLREVDKPDISISRSFDFHLDLLWFLFPMVIFRPLFLGYFKRQISWEVEKNLYRLTSELNEKINKEMDRLMVQALSYMNEELQVIQALLSEETKSSRFILERKNKLRAMLETNLGSGPMRCSLDMNIK